jgi:hypothetical protein
MAIDLFSGNRPDNLLHPQYLKTRDNSVMAPAKAMLSEIAATMDDPDGNFVEQFQTHGFDARTFEIYLQALFTEAGHTIDRSFERPDFLITKDGLTVAVEAVTANPPPGPDFQPYELFPKDGPKTKEEALQHLQHEMAIRLGSPLYTKLQKKYWELPQVRGRPFVIALEVFHGGGLALSSSSVSRLLFGLEHGFHFDESGSLVVESEQISEHKGSKTIPSNFFSSAGAEHLSGVLYSNAGTVPKFGRLGQEGAHHSDRVRMVRLGNCLDPDPNATMPELFAYEVGDPEILPEPWRDGAVLIHNPHAIHPIPPGWLGAGGEESLTEGGTVALSYNDPFQVFASLTLLFDGKVTDEQMWQMVDLHMKVLEMGQTIGQAWRDDANG